MKAILEMEMPDLCAGCPLCKNDKGRFVCMAEIPHRAVKHPNVRALFCPLKIVSAETPYPDTDTEELETPKPLVLPAMTLRDYFAGQALAGGLNGSPLERVSFAYKCASAMLAAREEAR
jgi:hypothetical protein